MVIKECILKANEILRASGTDTSVLDARVLLCHVLGKSDVYVVTNPDENISETDRTKFFELIERRAKDEPVAYITGEKEFMSLSFYVDKNVLIPRPDTEHLAELAIELVNKYNICQMTQSDRMCLADKMIYELRGVTGTVDSVPLIASSIMSKKLAMGSDKILLDVTCGSGAFASNLEQAKELARQMVDIGNKNGKETVAVITNMDEPLGKTVGNSLEIIEAIEFLKG